MVRGQTHGGESHRLRHGHHPPSDQSKPGRFTSDSGHLSDRGLGGSGPVPIVVGSTLTVRHCERGRNGVQISVPVLWCIGSCGFFVPIACRGIHFMISRSCRLTIVLTSLLTLGLASPLHAQESRKTLAAVTESYAQQEERIRALVEDSKYDEAERAAVAYIAAARQTDGDLSVAFATAISYRAYVLLFRSRFEESSRLFDQALAVYRSSDGPPQFIASAMNNLGQVRQAQGRNADAEKLYTDALALQEQQLAPTHVDIATSLANLAHMHQLRGEAPEAERLLRRALSIRTPGYPTNHFIVATTLQNLATAIESQGRLSEAESLLRQALRMRQASQSPTHPQLAGAMHRLAVNLYRQRKHADAERLFLDALRIRRTSEAFLPDRARNLTDLAQIYILQRRFRDAEQLLSEALGIYQRVVPPGHPFIAEANRDLAYVAEGLRQLERALTFSRRATMIYVERRARDSNARVQYQNHVELAWARSTVQGANKRALLDEAFTVAQRATVTDTELSVARMSARLASQDAGLQTAIRERQDLEATRQRLERDLVATIAHADQQARAHLLREDIARASTRMEELDRHIGTAYPQYQALVQPNPLTPTDVQAALGPDEVLIKLFLTFDNAYVWAISRTNVAWQKLAIDSREIESRIAELRRGLEASSPAQAKKDGVLFDLVKAHELYRLLLQPVEGVFARHPQLLVVANGFLTSLPLQALVTTTPAIGKGRGAWTEADYAGAAWLARRQAVSVLPSVSNLTSLQRVAAGAQTRKPLIGFANPQFSIGQTPRVAQAATTTTRSVTRSFGSYWRSGGPDLQSLRSLAPLPNTERELRGVAQLLHADDAPLHFGVDANEPTVRSARLQDYRVVYFATHALVAGELNRLAEPALALAVPNSTSPENDGLLTASEVAQLQLDADWVILSACNTAAGNRQGAEALSGLAQAFFYAGSRALMVSHWAVDDYSAAALMVLTFDAVAQSPQVGRAGALQKAMLARIADTERPWSAYPSYWAPFFVVGLNR